MLGTPPSFEGRRALRIELSDYLLDRIDEPWMHDIMASCQELEWADVHALRSVATHVPPELILSAKPPAVAAAIAEPLEVAAVVAKPDEETFEAIRWATKLQDDSSVLAVLEALPNKVVEEQVMLYKKRNKRDHATMVAAAAQAQPPPKIHIGKGGRFAQRMKVAERFHSYMQEEGIAIDQRFPRGLIK